MPSNSSANPQVSAIICTFNRGVLLKNALASLIGQTLSPSMYEIIVVDNGSQDDTISIVKTCIRENPHHNIRLIAETRQGLGYARESGGKAALAPIIGYLDDDAKAAPNWLEIVTAIWQEITPTPIAAGGPIYPYYSSPAPTWYKESYETRTKGDRPRFLVEKETFSGSNMFIKREAFLSVCGSGAGLGMTGNFIGVGEETILFEKLWRQQGGGQIFYYSPELVVNHLVAVEKYEVAYWLKRALISGATDIQRENWAGPRKYAHAGYLFLRFLKLSLMTLAERRRYQHRQHWIVESVTKPFYLLGNVFGSLGLSIKFHQRSRKASN